jgi:hypothetical protein
MKDENKNILSEPQPDYEKAEIDLLRDALKRNDTERFKMMATLMKIGFMMKRAKIIHKDMPYKNE